MTLRIMRELERVKRAVAYTQLTQGEKFGEGTDWVRSEKNFLSRVRRDGKLVPVFELVKETDQNQ